MWCLPLLALGCSQDAGDDGGGDGDGDGGSVGTGATSGDGDGAGGTSASSCQNCSNGCCDGDTCVPFAIQTDDQCGADNSMCAACDFGRACGDAGSCEVDQAVCSPLTCEGCCADEATCIEAEETDSSFCGAGGEECGRCDYGAQCTGDGTCSTTIDPDAVFYITVESVQLEQTNQGASWDPIDPPDPYVCVTNGTNEECTEPCGDSLSCSYDVGGMLGLEATGYELAFGYLSFQVWDDDGVGDDEAGSITPVATELSSDGYTESSFGSVQTLTFSIRENL